MILNYTPIVIVGIIDLVLHKVFKELYITVFVLSVCYATGLHFMVFEVDGLDILHVHVYTNLIVPDTREIDFVQSSWMMSDSVWLRAPRGSNNYHDRATSWRMELIALLVTEHLEDQQCDTA